jgi:hypothetical protein
MFDLMSFKLQMKFLSEYSGQGTIAEWPAQKDNILLRQGVLLESSFDTTPRDGKTTASSKASLPRYCRLRAAPLPDEVATSSNRDRGHSDQSATM